MSIKSTLILYLSRSLLLGRAFKAMADVRREWAGKTDADDDDGGDVLPADGGTTGRATSGGELDPEAEDAVEPVDDKLLAR